MGAAVANGNVPDELNDYVVLLTAGLIVYPFSLFEAGLRRIVRAIDPTACSGGATDFKGIYDWLFARLRQDGWAYAGGEAVEFLDLYRNIRNTIHNNGKFYSRTATDAVVTWKGNRHEFIHGAVPPFVEWDFNLRLLCELVRLNRGLMEAPAIGRLPPIP